MHDYSECARCLCTLALSRINTHTQTQPLSHSLTHMQTESVAPTNWTKSRLLAPTAEQRPCALSLSICSHSLRSLGSHCLCSLSLCAVLLPLHSSACEVNELQRLCQCLFNERRQRTWQRLRQRQRSLVDPSWMSLKWRSLCKYWRGKELEECRRNDEGGTYCMFA